MFEFLSESTIEWDKEKVKKEGDAIADNCEGCIKKKRTPCNPAACIPISSAFNEVVAVDLKLFSNELIILYVIDLWSKLMQARCQVEEVRGDYRSPYGLLGRSLWSLQEIPP